MIWHYSHDSGWKKEEATTEIPSFNQRFHEESVPEYASRMGYGEYPVISSGSEHVLLTVWESKHKCYLVQFEIDEFSQ